MIRTVIYRRDGSEVAVVGVDAENLRRMQAGQPVIAPFARFSPRWNGLAVCVMYGETEQAIRDEIEAAAGAKAPGVLRDSFLTRADALDHLCSVVRELPEPSAEVRDALTHVAEFDLR